MERTNKIEEAVDASQEQPEYVQGFAITGAEVEALTDKHFEIVKTPEYRSVPDLDKAGQMKQKMILTVKLADGNVTEYYPNKTSIGAIMRKAGRALVKWKGYKGEWFTEVQKVGKSKLPVIYVMEV